MSKRTLLGMIVSALLVGQVNNDSVYAAEGVPAEISVMEKLMQQIKVTPRLSRAEKADALSSYNRTIDKYNGFQEDINESVEELERFEERAAERVEQVQKKLLEDAKPLMAEIKKHNDGDRRFGPGEEHLRRAYNAKAGQLNQSQDDLFRRGEAELQHVVSELVAEEQRLMARYQQHTRKMHTWIEGDAPDSPRTFTIKWGNRIVLNSRAMDQLRQVESLSRKARTAAEDEKLEKAYRLLRDAFDSGTSHSNSSVVDLRDIDASKPIHPRRR